MPRKLIPLDDPRMSYHENLSDQPMMDYETNLPSRKLIQRNKIQTLKSTEKPLKQPEWLGPMDLTQTSKQDHSTLSMKMSM